MLLGLECGLIWHDPDDEEIETAIRWIAGFSQKYNDEGVCEQLHRSDDHWIQVLGRCPERYGTSSHRHGGGVYYECPDDYLSVYPVVRAFQQFARGDDSYKHELQWRACAG